MDDPSVDRPHPGITWSPPRITTTHNHSHVYVTKDWIEYASVRYVLIALHVAAIAASALGNGVLLYLLLRYKKLRVHITAYLILNLALCDFLDAVVHQPMRLVDIIAMDSTDTKDQKHHMPIAYCQVTGFFSTYVSCVASHTIMVISIERFLLICKPLYARRFLTISITKYLLFAIWTLAFIVVLPLPLLYTYVAQIQLESGYVSFCLIDVFHTNEHNGDLYFVSLFLIYFAVPAAITTVMYAFVFRALNKQTDCLSQHDENQQKILQSRKDLAKLMLFLAILFTALHGPFFFLFLLISCGLRPPNNPIFTLLIIEFLPLLNGALDPIVYSSKSRTLFRRHMLSFLSRQHSLGDENRKSLTSSIISKISSVGKLNVNGSRRGSTPGERNKLDGDALTQGMSGSYRSTSDQSSTALLQNQVPSNDSNNAMAGTAKQNQLNTKTAEPSNSNRSSNSNSNPTAEPSNSSRSSNSNTTAEPSNSNRSSNSNTTTSSSHTPAPQSTSSNRSSNSRSSSSSSRSRTNLPYTATHNASSIPPVSQRSRQPVDRNHEDVYDNCVAPKYTSDLQRNRHSPSVERDLMQSTESAV